LPERQRCQNDTLPMTVCWHILFLSKKLNTCKWSQQKSRVHLTS
jgi:hypothetical protein